MKKINKLLDGNGEEMAPLQFYMELFHEDPDRTDYTLFLRCGDAKKLSYLYCNESEYNSVLQDCGGVTRLDIVSVVYQNEYEMAKTSWNENFIVKEDIPVSDAEVIQEYHKVFNETPNLSGVTYYYVQLGDYYPFIEETKSKSVLGAGYTSDKYKAFEFLDVYFEDLLRMNKATRVK